MKTTRSAGGFAQVKFYNFSESLRCNNANDS